MASEDSTGRGWNPFALELQNILRKYGLDLGHLDDRMGIHREKVRSLPVEVHRFPLLVR